MGTLKFGFWQGTLIACALVATACNGEATGGETLPGEGSDKGSDAPEVTGVAGAAGAGEGAERASGETAQALASAKCIDIRRDKGYLVEDSFIANDRPEINWGTNVNVLVGKVNGGLRQSLFKFDTSSIPKRAQIVSATLKLTILNNYLVGNSPLKLYRVTTPWTEAAVTWGSLYAGGTPYAPTPVASFSPAPGGINIDVKAVVQSWVTDGLAGTSGTYPNQGFLVDQPVQYATAYTTFRSSETNTTYGTNYPTLSVCYVVAGPPSTEIVNAGTTSTSTNYKAVYTLGQPTSNQGKMTSPGFRAQGGLIGATGTLP